MTEFMDVQALPNNIIQTCVQIVSSSFKRISKLRKAMRFIHETLQMWIDRIRFKAEKKNCNAIEI